MAVTHVIFDFDGLLVDTEPCSKAAHEKILGRYGIALTPEMISYLTGRKEEEGFPWLIKKAGIADKITFEQYLAEHDSVAGELYRSNKAKPGAERLVRHFHKKGVPIAMCSGSRKAMYPPRREPHKDWLDLIPLQARILLGLLNGHVFCGEEKDIKRGKPFPDPFLATMKRFPVLPSDTSKVLVFEDSLNGGRAAVAANMRCVMVPEKQNRAEAMKIGATQVLSSLEEFRPEEFGLPPFD
ncbi:HAD hydrolase, family IA, variant 3 [Oesophagostomum dentatum]|uniref:HAD hydrolase, family IA, variant 3 n=1 Tax=Oesophagostomum dentatum TaxID=61180 RepID=A0A0B1SJY1_OESDE|nr:HAD hydrolase, family IA, variant 3 [Oesophagostomum dentatum]